jgi:ribosomal protein S18 acetylase RimI-like enzyme
MRIKFIKAPDTWALRHRVLRPHQTLEDCDYPNDRNPDSFHLGVFIGEHLVCIGSFYAEKNMDLKGWKQYRLRGMATHPDFQNQGAGTKLLTFALDHLKAQRADLLWCNARSNAKAFYERANFTVVGVPFTIEGVGEHYVMQRRI